MGAGGDLPLLLALAALAAADSVAWAAVGVPELGGLAAAQAGLDLATGLVVSDPGPRAAQVLAVLLESVPVVLVGASVRVPERAVRRLRAVMRRSGAGAVGGPAGGRERTCSSGWRRWAGPEWAGGTGCSAVAG